MSPKHFSAVYKDEWASLVTLWSELSRCSSRAASRNLIDNAQGDYTITWEDEEWIFEDAHSGLSYAHDPKTGEWNETKG